MTLFGEEKNRLVAFRHGFAPYADDLDCTDVRGPGSLFGEATLPPKPLCDWTPPSDSSRAFAGTCILWEEESPEGTTPQQRAEAITGQTEFPSGRQSIFSVPAATFLAGRSTSSFSLAWDLVEKKLLPEWGAVICSCQTEGRGQLRRPWFSPRGNLYVTFRLPGHSLLQGDAASLLTGYLLARSLRRLGFSVSLKWPNDLLLEDRLKIGGILLEEKDGVLLAGLGINLAEYPPQEQLRQGASVPAGLLLPYHSSSIQESHPGFRVEQEEPLAPFGLWRLLVSHAILEYRQTLLGQCLADLLPGVETLLCWKGRKIAVGDDRNSAIHGNLDGLGPSGGLRLCLDNGDVREFVSGSVFLSV